MKTITVNINREDYADFNNYYISKKMAKKSLYVTLVFSAIISLALWYEFSFDMEEFVWTFIIAFGFQHLIKRVLHPLTLKLTGLVPSKDGLMLGEKKFIFDDESLMQESNNSNCTIKWKAVMSIEESKRSVFIFIDSMAAFIIPKRDIGSEEDVQELVNFMEEKTGLNSPAESL